MRSSPPLVPGPTPRRQLPVRATRQHFPMSHYFSATTRRGPPRREKSCWIYMEPLRAHARDGHAQLRTRWCAKRGSCLDGRSTTQRFWMRSATDVRLACVLHVRSVHQNAPLRGGHGVLGPDKGEIRTAPRPCSINSSKPMLPRLKNTFLLASPPLFRQPRACFPELGLQKEPHQKERKVCVSVFQRAVILVRWRRSRSQKRSRDERLPSLAPW